MSKIKKDEFTNLVKEIYEERTGTTIKKNELEPLIDDVFFAVEEALLDGKDVSIGKVGTLKVKERNARKGVNPKLLKELKDQGVPAEEAKKQAEIDIAASKALTLTPNINMKDALKNK